MGSGKLTVRFTTPRSLCNAGMNVFSAAPPAALWDRYVQLTPGLRRLLWLKGLIVPPITKSDFVECLRATGSRAPDGKAWSAVSANTGFDALRRQWLMTSDNACPPALLHPVAVDAGASGDADALAAAITRILPGQRPVYHYSTTLTVVREAVHRLLRLAVYTNNEADFIRNRDLCDKVLAPERTVMVLANTFYDVPLEAGWIASRHPVIQAPLLEAKLNAFIVTGLGGPEMPGMIALCRTLRGQVGFGDMAAQLSRYDLLAGAWDALQDSIEEQILLLHRDKRDLASDLLEGTETTARLSEGALLDLIRA